VPALAALLLALASTPPAAATTTAADVSTPPQGAVIELPKITVTDDRILPPPESWRYARIPGFEVLSNAGDRTTRRFLEDFQMLRSAIDIVWPAANQATSQLPAHLIICAKGGDFETFFPAEKSEDAFYSNSLFLHDREQSVIVLDLRPAEFQLRPDEIYTTDPYRSFYASYFRFLIRRGSGGKAPAWFEEGLVQILSHIDFDKKFIELGRVDNATVVQSLTETSQESPVDNPENPPPQGNSATVNGQFTGKLAQRALMKFGDVFTKQPTEAREKVIWQAQCEAFVHMCIYGRGKIYQKGLLNFVARSVREPVSEELFKDCFKQGYKDMAIELRGYCELTDHQYLSVKGKKNSQLLPDPVAPELREATDAESGRIKGDALRLGGHLTEARNSLIAPYQRGERDPQLLAALGLNELAAAEPARARKFLEAAFKAQTFNVRGLVELARLRLDEALAAKPELSPEQTKSILAPLAAAARQQPPVMDTYELAAKTWLNSSDKPARELLFPLVQGATLFKRPALAYNAALVFAKYRFLTDANALIDFGLQLTAGNPQAQKKFQDLRATLPPVPPQGK
jgi:hypothetical protein